MAVMEGEVRHPCSLTGPVKAMPHILQPRIFWEVRLDAFLSGHRMMPRHTSRRRLLFQLNDECIDAGWIVKVAQRSSQRAVPGA